MTRYDHRSAFLLLGWNCQVEDKVESIDDSIDASTVLEVDDGIGRRAEDISCAHDVGAPEEHNRVAVGVRRFWMEHLNRFTIEEEILFSIRVGVGWPGADGCGR